MKRDIQADGFLKNYSLDVRAKTDLIRDLISLCLPDVQEQVDLPAKMLSYCYGAVYSDMVCVLFPSKKGVKLSFYKGVELPDPKNILRGNAKTTRYIEIKQKDELNNEAISELLNLAYLAYKERSLKTKQG